VSAEMGEVERADGPGNHDEVHLIRAGKENRDVANRVVLYADPEIGRTWSSHGC
jgi:hypothetical protein